MLDPKPIPTSALTDGTSPPARPSGETKRHLLAALFSAIVPGAGQLFLGQRRKGITLLIMLAALLSCFWPLRLLRVYPGLVLLFCAWIVLYFYAACAAQLSPNGSTGTRLSKWWLVIVLPLTSLTLTLLGRAVTRASGFRAFSIPSTSMEKTILQGDELVADMRYYHSHRPERREAVIFLRDRTFYIKRVIAIGGDSIQGKDNLIFINGTEQDEPYVENTDTRAQDWMKTFGPVAVPDGKYFVMGDNRDVSLDSRAAEFGLVDDTSIVGKPLFVLASHRAGKSIR